MLGRSRSVAVVGLRAVPVTVEAHVGAGLPSFSIIGSSGTAAAQAADRVRTALGAIGVTLPARKVLVSLAPADLPKAGARFDLAMAVAVLAALGVVPEQPLQSAVLLGELALDASVRPVTGVLPSAASLQPDVPLSDPLPEPRPAPTAPPRDPGAAAADASAAVAQTGVPPGAADADADASAAAAPTRAGGPRLFVAVENAAEAALVAGLDVVPIADLGAAVDVLRGAEPCRPPCPPAPAGREDGADLADVRGQAEGRRALEVAAAGGHHLLLLGPPGCGKSMLARRLPSILPPLTHAQALELAAVRSVAGRYLDAPDGVLLDRAPPFRAPHHTGSTAALLGGGTGVARPGELSLAHNGVLFLDELFEWPRTVLEGLREPLEEGVVRVSRSRATVTYPARVQLAAASNPCPCGGGPDCACDEESIWSYRARLSGALADRMDLACTLEPLRAADLLAPEAGESSADVAARVASARATAVARWGPGRPNAEAPAPALRALTTPRALRLLADAVECGELSGRGYDRILRVARTCADLAGTDLVHPDHILEARAHRLPLRARLPLTAAR